MDSVIAMEDIRVNHQVVHADAFTYSAHPHLLAAAPDNWLLVFTQSRRRAGVRSRRRSGA